MLSLVEYQGDDRRYADCQNGNHILCGCKDRDLVEQLLGICFVIVLEDLAVWFHDGVHGELCNGEIKHKECCLCAAEQKWLVVDVLVKKLRGGGGREEANRVQAYQEVYMKEATATTNECKKDREKGRIINKREFREIEETQKWSGVVCVNWGVVVVVVVVVVKGKRVSSSIARCCPSCPDACPFTRTNLAVEVKVQVKDEIRASFN